MINLYKECYNYKEKLSDNKYYYSLDENHEKYSHPIRSKFYNWLYSIKEYMLIKVIQKSKILNILYLKLKKWISGVKTKSKINNQDNDITSVVKKYAESGELKVYFGNHIVQDNLKALDSLFLTWKEGKLYDKNKNEFKYFHFYHLKKHKKFCISPYKRNLLSFNISREGIFY